MSKTTVSRLLKNADEANHTLLRKWCDIVATKGGSFQIVTEYSVGAWATTYTIHWPDVVEDGFEGAAK